ncbi:hypothetical protein REPUB_Repub20aG0046800 [Reevesia pubescens]
MATTRIGRIRLGSQGLEVSAQGLGCMGMSAIYGPPKLEADMVALIHPAINSGITLLDTSDVYGPRTNEILLGKALKDDVRDRVELASKFGIHLTGHEMEIRSDPAYVRAACEGSLKRLGMDCIDLYYQHRLTTGFPLKSRFVFVLVPSPAAFFVKKKGNFLSFQLINPCFNQMGELKKLVEEGKIKYIGSSKASASTITRAHAVHPITAVRLEWSLWSRDVEEEIVPTCRELGIGIVTCSPLGRGFLSLGPKIGETSSNHDF